MILSSPPYAALPGGGWWLAIVAAALYLLAALPVSALRRVSAVIARVTGRSAPSLTRTWQMLREMGWSCQRPERRARQQDANAVRTFRTRTWSRLKKTPENNVG